MRRWRRMWWGAAIPALIVVICAVVAKAAEPQQSKSLHLMASLPQSGDVWITENTLGFGSGITINTRTGEVTIPKGMTPSEAAREFWNAVAVLKGAPPPFPSSMPNGKATLEKRP